MLVRLTFITICLFFSLASVAKLPTVYFDDLLADAELVVYGEVFSITYNNDYSGTAKIRIMDVVKGSYQGSSIEYSWTNSPHSRDIDKAAQRYVVFIKKQGDNYVSSALGAGVWIVHLNIDDFNKSIVVNDFVDDLPESIFENIHSDEAVNKKITLDSLKRFFKRN